VLDPGVDSDLAELSQGARDGERGQFTVMSGRSKWSRIGHGRDETGPFST